MKSLCIPLLSLPFLTISLVVNLERGVSTSEYSSFDSLDWMKFEWVGDSLGNRYFDRAGINLPVRIQGMPHDFTFQFDLGSDLSVLYGRAVKPYLSLYPEFQQRLDSSSGYTLMKHVSIVIDDQLFQDWDLFYNQDFGATISIDSAKSKTLKHLGTIGADLLQGRVLIIDYPNTRLAVTGRVLPDIADRTSFIDISLDRHGRVHLPLTIQGEEQTLLFDTGASLFPLSTTPEHWAAVTNQPVTDSILTSTWGKHYYTYGAPVDDIYLGDRQLPSATCYKNDYLTDFMKKYNLGGVTGNAYFVNDVVVIDFANQKFGLMN